ncbi:MAG: hypothetical protein IJE19_03065 [Clostridia bacterium]|nr:hypothetical protein [Clostridia bacterium]
MDKTMIIFFALLFIFIIVALIAAVKIFGEQKVKNWLVYAVSLAESELGSGTGQLKLRSVYNMFVLRFPKLSMIITFARFSELVDDALGIMREMLKNDKIANIISKTKEE